MEYHDWLERMQEMDPDYIVDVLDISSEELLDAFEDKAELLYEQEFGEG